jgi:hypothetical protein
LLRLSGLLPYPVHIAVRDAETRRVTGMFSDIFRKYVPQHLRDAAERELLAAADELRAA